MIPKLLDFSKVAGETLDRREPEVTSDRFAGPCTENGSVRDYLRSLPTFGSGGRFREMIRMLAGVRRAGRPLLLGIGAGVLDEGVSPVIIELMERGLLSGIALTGNAVFRDVEIAMTGGLCPGFGTEPEAFYRARETAEMINSGVNCGAEENMGLGEALGAYLAGRRFANGERSLLVAAGTFGVPATVHLTIGAEAAHFLPSASGEAIGRTAHLDFRIFATQVANLQGGVYINSGSPVTLPEVFMKALLAVRALGYRIDDFSTLSLGGGPAEPQAAWRTGIGGDRVSCYQVDGAYGLIYPLIAACLLDELSENC